MLMRTAHPNCLKLHKKCLRKRTDHMISAKSYTEFPSTISLWFRARRACLCDLQEILCIKRRGQGAVLEALRQWGTNSTIIQVKVKRMEFSSLHLSCVCLKIHERLTIFTDRSYGVLYKSLGSCKAIT